MGPPNAGVYLLKGQALFQVAHGKRIPFKVCAGSQRITRGGERVFNVRLEGAEVQVAMVGGGESASRRGGGTRSGIAGQGNDDVAGEARTGGSPSPCSSGTLMWRRW